MKKRFWLRHNYPLLATMVGVFLGVMLAYVLISLIPFSRSRMLKLLVMVATGVVFGWTGFRLSIMIERRTRWLGRKSKGVLSE